MILPDDGYYGLPSKVWEDLCIQAEDMLYEKNIGQHIVGIYPFSFLIENPKKHEEFKGLYILYIDSIENIINPFSKPNDKTHNYKENDLIISFTDLHFWSSRIGREFPDCNIPLENDIIYQDDSIDSIISAAIEYNTTKTEKDKELLAQEVINFYRFML